MLQKQEMQTVLEKKIFIFLVSAQFGTCLTTFLSSSFTAWNSKKKMNAAGLAGAGGVFSQRNFTDQIASETWL